MTDLAEVNVRPTSQCWKCRGRGTKPVKNADKNVSTPSLVTCPVCNGVGSLEKKLKVANPNKPMKEFANHIYVGPTPPVKDPIIRSDEELNFIAGCYRIYQYLNHFRYSTDDLVTAWVAFRVSKMMMKPKAELTFLDLGTGLGSVLLCHSWLHPESMKLIGIEAQEERYKMAVRSVTHNGLDSRVRVINGDIRDPSILPNEFFDIITGTPPYFSAVKQEGSLPTSEMTSRCLFEYRGGVEAYCEAASLRMHERSLFVCAESSLGLERGYIGAKAAGLSVIGRVDVIPKDNKPPLICVYIMCKQGSEHFFSDHFTESSVPVTKDGDSQGNDDLKDASITESDKSDNSTSTNIAEGRKVLCDALFGPLDRSELPYADMRSDEYARVLEELIQPDPAEVELERIALEKEKEAEADALNGKRKRKEKQKLRGTHVDYWGKPFVPGEFVYVHHVRKGTKSNRTEQHHRLLWELGKPSS